MADELYNLIFRGDIVDGHQLADVKAGFARLFKLDPAKIDVYFAGKPALLRKDCDLPTAEKFKAAMYQIGAILEIKPVSAAAAPSAPTAHPAPAAPAPAARPAAAQPAPAAAPSPAAAPAAKPASTVDPWSLSPSGSTLIRPEEIVRPEPVQVSIEHINVVKRNPFSADAEEPLEAEHNVTPPALDLSGYQLGKAGEALAEYREFVPLELDLSALTLDAPGADLLRPEDLVPVMEVAVDISELSLAPPGGDLGEIKPPPPPPPPVTDHLSVQK